MTESKESIYKFLSLLSTNADTKKSGKMKLQKGCFKEMKQTAENGLFYTIYCRDGVEVPEEQMRCTTSSDVFRNSESGPCIWNLMKSVIGTEEVPIFLSYAQRPIANIVVW